MALRARKVSRDFEKWAPGKLWNAVAHQGFTDDYPYSRFKMH